MKRYAQEICFVNCPLTIYPDSRQYFTKLLVCWLAAKFVLWSDRVKSEAKRDKLQIYIVYNNLRTYPGYVLLRHNITEVFGHTDKETTSESISTEGMKDKLSEVCRMTTGRYGGSTTPPWDGICHREDELTSVTCLLERTMHLHFDLKRFATFNYMLLKQSSSKFRPEIYLY